MTTSLCPIAIPLTRPPSLFRPCFLSLGIVIVIIIASHHSGYKPLPFIVMEELQQLPKYVNMRGPEHARLSFEQVLQLAKDLSDALLYLHEQVGIATPPPPSTPPCQ